MPKSVTRDRAEIRSASRNRAVVCLPLSSVVAPLPLCLRSHLESILPSGSLLGSVVARPGLTQKQVQQRLLSVQSIFGLVEDAAPRTVYDPGRDLLTPMRRQTVQEDGVFCGEGH
jgi:hypothetical protein